MLKDASLPLGIGIAFVSVLLSPATAEMATTADLSGRKICWDNGNISSFFADGKYSSPVLGNGTWSATTKGVEIHADAGGVLLDVDKQPDGTFKSRVEHASGKYCE